MDSEELLQTIDDICNLGTPEIRLETENDNPEESFAKTNLEKRGFIEEQISEIQLGLEQNLPVQRYAKDCYNWMQMREIRLGLLAGLKTERYENPLFNSEQMCEIRMGLLEGVSVACYAKLIYTATDMAKARRRLLETRYKQDPHSFDREVKDESIGVIIRTKENCLKAYLVLPSGGEYSLRTIRKALSKNDILFGIDENAIKNAIKNNIFDQEILIAQGVPALDGHDGKYEYYFNHLLPESPKILEDGSVDYREVVVAEKKKMGDLLAKYIPCERGKNGTTVNGVNIEGFLGKELAPLKGVGFIRNEANNTYMATIDGFVVCDEDRGTLNVWNVYEVDGDVNRYNGHIFYDGIVHIKGSVSDSAVIEAEGDIIVDGFVEAATLKSWRNVLLKGGMNGHGKGTIAADGKVLGSFFESVSITARGNVEASYFMNCEVETDSKICASGSPAEILGGHLQALYGVEAAMIGLYGSSKATVEVGDMQKIAERKKIFERDLDKVNDELNRLQEGKNRLSIMLSNGASKNDIFQKTCLAIKIKEEQKDSLESEIEVANKMLEKAKRAYIKVSGKIQEDVTLSVNGNSIILKKALSTITLTNKNIRGEAFV